MPDGMHFTVSARKTDTESVKAQQRFFGNRTDYAEWYCDLSQYLTDHKSCRFNCRHRAAFNG
ncbi:hypothetical protein GCM10010869_05200 [Mesorhizobium tianshanense]|nr:hypothetical protein GCM10010869_05200 [Mesorhizobium tianshanense]